ncbi:CCGSCS motif protein [Vibrio sp. S9_S30]|uniref:CCGSCS motif protein n=1 Tax=Vibrio sp. S9_S30 TaxID=2720226 RepID=UPI00168125EA|nr:CCGSCS motif protein [Vibrio sp. S9_S30]MBD1557174.1 CCGSCS motif protein [Vibrio sp. S9_S30]
MMTLSIKKIFQKKDSKAEAKVTEEHASTEASAKENSEERKSKHDTPSGCCGGCS